jgi:hypothetical protein
MQEKREGLAKSMADEFWDNEIFWSPGRNPRAAKRIANQSFGAS